MRSSQASRAGRWWLAGIVVGALLAPGEAQGGGGPENVLVVVNPKSPDSLAIANAYVHLRKIPSVNVVHLPFDPDNPIVPTESLRKTILRPIFETINQRRLAGQIDCVAYSSDYPWGIDLRADVQRYLDAQPTDRRAEWPKVLTQRGSLTGLTYLWQPVMAGRVEFMSLSSNRYARQASAAGQTGSTRAFDGRLQFDAQGAVVSSGGESYLLSVQLAATAGKKNRRGNTPVEVFSYLARSAAVDGTRPKGTVYFASTKDVRCQVRAGLFPVAVRALGELGVGAQIITERVPQDCGDVLGLTLGTADFDWPASRSRILSGAICDNLTSAGAVLWGDASQTPLTEFLRHGAAGASGTVIEPYSIPSKFPSPMIHVHYARGCSLAEAFYQSVEAPYQLLVVGDPLCQPWARPPAVTLVEPRAGATVRGKIELKPSAQPAGGEKLDHFELFVDGVLAGVAKPEDALSLDTAARPDGQHEIRVVAVGPGPIHARGRAIVPLRFANHGRQIEASASPTTLALGGTLTVTAKCPGAAKIEVSQNHQLLGTIRGASGSLEVQAAALGAGPSRLEVVGLFGDPGPRDRVLAPPIAVTVQWPGR